MKDLREVGGITHMLQVGICVRYKPFLYWYTFAIPSAAFCNAQNCISLSGKFVLIGKIKLFQDI